MAITRRLRWVAYIAVMESHQRLCAIRRLCICAWILVVMASALQLAVFLCAARGCASAAYFSSPAARSERLYLM